ncbi:MAG: 2-amino-4-hydroxy-6-hydroxymethyldihydropteridine diphosphokinase [Pseudomonadota bacterium]
MILIALGANLPHPEHGAPAQTLRAAAERLIALGLSVFAGSHIYQSSPVPPSGQPDFANAVLTADSHLPAQSILRILHQVEAEFGRERRVRWDARLLDLDLLAVDDRVLPDRLSWHLQAERRSSAAAAALIVPHPRLHDRRFVLEPLVEVAPDWVHPVLQKSVREMRDQLDVYERRDPMGARESMVHRQKDQLLGNLG